MSTKDELNTADSAPAVGGPLERRVMAPLPKLLGDGGACLWCGKKLLGQCKSQYDSLTCVERPWDEEVW